MKLTKGPKETGKGQEDVHLTTMAMSLRMCTYGETQQVVTELRKLAKAQSGCWRGCEVAGIGFCFCLTT